MSDALGWGLTRSTKFLIPVSPVLWTHIICDWDAISIQQCVLRYWLVWRKRKSKQWLNVWIGVLSSQSYLLCLCVCTRAVCVYVISSITVISLRFLVWSQILIIVIVVGNTTPFNFCLGGGGGGTELQRVTNNFKQPLKLLFDQIIESLWCLWG